MKIKNRKGFISFIAKGVVLFFAGVFALSLAVSMFRSGSNRGNNQESQDSVPVKSTTNQQNSSEKVLPSGLSESIIRRVVESQAYNVESVNLQLQYGGDYQGKYLVTVNLSMNGQDLEQVIDYSANDSLTIRDQLRGYDEIGEIMFNFQGTGENGQSISMKTVVNSNSEKVYNVSYNPPSYWSSVSDRFTRFR